MTSTYEKIATNTLGSATASVTFSSISGSYTDLVLVVNAGASSAGFDFAIRFNSDTGNNYSHTRLRGNGSAASSLRASNNSFINTLSISTTIDSNFIVSINNYSNSTTYKSVLMRANNSAIAVESVVGLWRNTSAITSITISPEFLTANFITGSTFTLYGIKAE
jgi:hypothetical protein